MGIHPAKMSIVVAFTPSKNACAESKRLHHGAGSDRRIEVKQTEADLLARRDTTTELAGLRRGLTNAT